MIDKLEIKNFKSIKHLEVEFKNLNVLCGENASGKTSIIHAVLVAAQQYKDQNCFDGNLIKIGGTQDIRTLGLTSRQKVEIKIMTSEGKSRQIILQGSGETAKHSILPKVKDLLHLEFEKDLFYLSSNRVGVVDAYSKTNYKFGIGGESIAEFYSAHREMEVPTGIKSALIAKFPSGVLINHYLEGHVRFWFRYIIEEEILLTPLIKTNKYVLTYRDANKVDKGIRSINTGSGLSFLAPIIITCLGAVLNGTKPVIIIENPENHLHPLAQIRLMEFLQFMSEFSQIIIETHSDHILREAIKDNLRNNQVLISRLDDRKETVVEVVQTSSFHINPISYAEVQYKALNLYTQELHEGLLSHIQINHTIGRSHGTRAMDRIFSSVVRCPHRTWVGKNNNAGTITIDRNQDSVTLPLYIRHYIHHPEMRQSDNLSFSYEELKSSIDFMLNYISNGFL
jgi:predicted ATPase